MNCIIIEDQPPAQRILKKFIEDTGTLHLQYTFSDALQALSYLKNHEVDLIFLDIHLPKISGLEFLKVLPNPPHIILTTAFPDYALESYEFSVVDYLLKPFSFQRFVKAVSKVPNKENSPTTIQNTIFIKSGYEHIKLTIDDILYIKSDGDYTEIILPHRKLLSSESLRYWLNHLDNHTFVRIHKSYIVHVPKIEKMVGNQLFLNHQKIIPIGRAYKETFVNRFITNKE